MQKIKKDLIRLKKIITTIYFYKIKIILTILMEIRNNNIIFLLIKINF